MSQVFEFSTLDQEIYSRFLEKNKYTLIELKKGIKEIFVNKGLEIKGINAKTILNYFEIKTCKILVDGKIKTDIG